MSVTLELPADPAAVAVARLVAVALARQCALPEETVEEIRLAVGEACARAVAVQAIADASRTVSVSLSDGPGQRLSVTVTDSGGPGAVPPGADHDHLFDVDLTDGLSLALLRGLDIDLALVATPDGTRLTMGWPPTGAPGAAG